MLSMESETSNHKNDSRGENMQRHREMLKQFSQRSSPNSKKNRHMGIYIPEHLTFTELDGFCIHLATEYVQKKIRKNTIEKSKKKNPLENSSQTETNTINNSTSSLEPIACCDSFNSKPLSLISKNSQNNPPFDSSSCTFLDQQKENIIQLRTIVNEFIQHQSHEFLMDPSSSCLLNPAESDSIEGSTPASSQHVGAASSSLLPNLNRSFSGVSGDSSRSSNSSEQSDSNPSGAKTGGVVGANQRDAGSNNPTMGDSSHNSNPTSSQSIDRTGPNPTESNSSIQSNNSDNSNNSVQSNNSNNSNNMKNILYNGNKIAQYLLAKFEQKVPLPRNDRIHSNLTIEAHEEQGRRNNMEDKHTVIADLNSLMGFQDYPEQSFFAIFDGHGGTEAAEYSKIHLHVNISRHAAFREDPETAIKEGFRITDENFMKLCEKEGYVSGATVVAVLIREKVIYVAWLGDSQAMMVKRAETIPLSVPHKPNREDEKKRIEESGGVVVWYGAWRVNGVLAVARAIGDRNLKQL
eukprot:Sdes_comp20658_c0_seq1m15965